MQAMLTRDNNEWAALFAFANNAAWCHLRPLISQVTMTEMPKKPFAVPYISLHSLNLDICVILLQF